MGEIRDYPKYLTVEEIKERTKKIIKQVEENKERDRESELVFGPDKYGSSR